MKGVEVMKSMLGWHEVRDKERLMKFFKTHSVKGDLTVDPSKTPWCAIIIGCCERAVGNDGTGKQNARSYLNYGQIVKDWRNAKEGDIAVFKRGVLPWQGHVNYILKVLDSGLLCIGGNQRDTVTEQLYTVERLLGVRRP